MIRSFVCLFALQLSAGFAVADQPAELSLAETEALLRSRVAAQWTVAPDEVTVAEAEAHTWTDSSLGCAGRRRPAASVPTPGYRFVVVVLRARATYHADTHGRILRCDSPAKPLDPLAREFSADALATPSATAARSPLLPAHRRAASHALQPA